MPQTDRDYLDEKLDTLVPVSPVAGSLNDILSKAAGGNTFDKATDSLEMLSDKLGTFSGDGGAAQDDSAKASLDLVHTEVGLMADALASDVATDKSVMSYIKGLIQELDQRKVAKFATGYDNWDAGGAYTTILDITDKGVLTGISVETSAGAGGTCGSAIKITIDGTLIMNGATFATTQASSYGHQSLAFQHRFNTSLKVEAQVGGASGDSVNVHVSYTTDD